MRAIVWFRADLRVRDNHALFHACSRASDGVVAVFTICAEQWKDKHDWSDAKVDFILRNLESLSEQLGKMNIPLKIVETPRFDGVAKALDKLAKDTACSELFFNREYEVNELRRDEAVTAKFMEAGRGVHAYTDQVMFAPGEIRTRADGWYTVFTPFKNAWRARFKGGEGPEVLGIAKKQPEIDIKADTIPEKVKGFDREARAVRPDLWKAGEDHARSRLKAFAQHRIDDYKEQRDLPSVNGTSTLSPYLVMGVVSPRQCVKAALDANGGRIDSGSKGAVTWIEELIWREFYKHVLVGFPRVCMGRAFRADMDSVSWSFAEATFERWKQGETGYPIVDAGMRQLTQTGWMHNRLRMIVAMFLTKDLMIDWRWGEKYFMQTLIDGDLAANNGGWQWSASTGTDAQPYFRIFNPTTQGEKFDPDGDFIRRFVPELADLKGKAIHNPSSAGVFAKLDYPEPVVDHKAAREKTLRAFKQASGKDG